MMHKVRKAFPWCPDGTGITREELAVGDVRSFGAMAEGLKSEGYIEDLPATPVAAVPADYEKLSRAELDALATERGIDISKAKNKPDVIALLDLSDHTAGPIEEWSDEYLASFAFYKGVDLTGITERDAIIAAIKQAAQA